MAYSSKSPWLIHYDGSSCNGCDIEVLDSMMPLYDIERFGIINTGNPKHADIFLVTGSVNAQNIEVVRHIYDQMLEPKVVVACGICACTGGVFRDCYNVIGGVDKAIPVDVYAPGCAVRPETIIDAVLEAVKILDKKAEAMKRGEDPAKLTPVRHACACEDEQGAAAPELVARPAGAAVFEMAPAKGAAKAAASEAAPAKAAASEPAAATTPSPAPSAAATTSSPAPSATSQKEA